MSAMGTRARTARPMAASARTLRARLGTAALLLGAAALLAGGAAAAEPLGAEVRTWDGQTWQLADVTVVTVHSVPPPPAHEAAPAPTDALASLAAAMGGRSRSGSASHSRPTESRLADPAGEPVLDARATPYLTLHQGGVVTRVELERVAALMFFRYPIADSQLPPYMAASHVRYAAVAILADGSRVEGDDVTLGPTVVRGRAPGARVAIPWTSIERLRFVR